MQEYPYEGLGVLGATGEADDPLPTFPTEDEAREHAKSLGLISPAGRRNEAELLAVEVPS